MYVIYEYGYWCARYLVRRMLPGKRHGVVLLGKAMAALTDFCKGVDVFIVEFSVENKTAQSLALPLGALLWQLENSLRSVTFASPDSFMLHAHSIMHKRSRVIWISKLLGSLQAPDKKSPYA
ncbi:hypothetical protein AZSI13_34090 [Azospira sp. I13]|nr:hypothetical protein AZSI13_34090 [Azospira sp. I13]